jgi:hypothetical protein
MNSLLNRIEKKKDNESTHLHGWEIGYVSCINGWQKSSTLYNVILRIARNFLETWENIKISTHPFYHINLD